VEGLVGALATVHAGPMGLLVPDDLTVEFVSQEVNGGIEVAVAGLAMDVFSRKVNRHLRSLIEFLNAQDNMDFIHMVEMAPGSTKSLVDIVAHGGGDIEMMSLDCQMHVAFLSEFFTLAYRLDSERFSILCNRAPRNLNPLGPETICNLLI
jgi:hypothetical protein